MMQALKSHSRIHLSSCWLQGKPVCGQLVDAQSALKSSYDLAPRSRLICSSGTPESQSSADNDGLEDLFAQELKRRGLNQGSSAEVGSTGAQPAAPARDPFATTKTRTRAPPPPMARNDGLDDQRQRSMEMVNEGLTGLIPRASKLLQLGGSVFLAFLPFMLVISILFSGIYAVFGDSFVHRGSARTGPIEYIDPERLLSESTVDPYVPFRQ